MNHPLCITWILSLASSLTIFIRFNFYFFPTFDGRFSIIVTSLENIIFCKNKISRLIFRFPNIRWANLKILNENFHVVRKWSRKISYWKSYFHLCWKVRIKVGKKSREKLSNFNLNFPASYLVLELPKLNSLTSLFFNQLQLHINYPLLTIWQFQCSIFSNFQLNQKAQFKKLDFESLTARCIAKK